MATGVSLEHPEMEADEPHRIESDPRYRLVQRILNTPDFVRSPQLSKFLLYICTAAFEDRSQSLNEQHIGVTVFGREPDYDSSADTIVRSHALRLRRRLEQYFQRAGRDEPIHLIIPRGSYAPVFLPGPSPSNEKQNADLIHQSDFDEALPGSSSAEVFKRDIEEHGSSSEHSSLTQHSSQPKIFSEEVESEVSPDPPLPIALSSVLWRYHLLTTFLIVLFIGLATAFGIHLHTHLRVDRRHILWGRLFTEDQPTHIVLGDSGLVLFHAVTRQHVSLHDYLNSDYTKQMPFVEHVDPKFAEFLRHRRYTSMVDATTLAHLLRLPEAIPERTLVHYGRDMHIGDFNSGNVIMIGAQEAVPWVELFEANMDFVFSIDSPDKHSSFLNRHRRAGEQSEYNSLTPSEKTKVYGVIAFLPNLSGNGNVLILEGLTMIGTEATINLAVNDDQILPILKSIRRPDGSLPHFEMLVESDALGEGAGPARIVSIHLHD
jgi:hypothetical protein